MATSSAPLFYQSNFQQFVDLGDELRLDIGDPELFRLLDGVSRGFYYTWVAGDQPPAVSFRFYRTVSLWWVIVILNGEIHAMDIEPGKQVFIPDIVQLHSIINKIKQKRLQQRRVVVI